MANKLTFIGGGNMAQSLVGGLLQSGFAAGHLAVSDPNQEKRDHFTKLQIATFADNVASIADADVVVFAVKPQVMVEALQQTKTVLNEKRPLIVSIAAGVRTKSMMDVLGGEQHAIVRCMPNTPALVGSGATALFATNAVSEEQREAAESIMRAVGVTLWVDEEAKLDVVTALSGSGPAYFFAMMEYLQKAAEGLGLSEDDARLLTLQTTFGAAKMALESDIDVAELRQRVTSKGGTTEAALQSLDAGGLSDLLATAVKAAAKRSQELGDELETNSK